MNDDYMMYDDSSAQVRNDITQIMEQGFSLNALVTIGLVHQNQNKSYKSPFFFYFGASPAGKKDAHGNTPYIREKGITISFKWDINRLLTMGRAIQAYADLAFRGWCAPPRGEWRNGNRQPGVPYSFTVWADPSKTQNANEQENNVSGKNVFVTVQPDTRNSGNNLVIICFNRGKEKSNNSYGQQRQSQNGQQGETQKKDNFPSISVALQPFEAMSLADTIFYMVDMAREMNLSEGAKRFLGASSYHSARYQSGQSRQPAPQNNGQQGGNNGNNGQSRPGPGLNQNGQGNTQSRQPAPQNNGQQGGNNEQQAAGSGQSHAYSDSTYQRKGFAAA